MAFSEERFTAIKERLLRKYGDTPNVREGLAEAEQELRDEFEESLEEQVEGFVANVKEDSPGVYTYKPQEHQGSGVDDVDAFVRSYK